MLSVSYILGIPSSPLHIPRFLNTYIEKGIFKDFLPRSLEVNTTTWVERELLVVGLTYPRFLIFERNRLKVIDNHVMAPRLYHIPFSHKMEYNASDKVPTRTNNVSWTYSMLARIIVTPQGKGLHAVLGKVLGTVSAFRLHWDFCRPRWGSAGIDSGQVILPTGI